TFKTSGSLTLLLFAIIIAAPLWEELLFRGFMHRGLQAGLGAVPAVVICSASWAIMHLQYDLINILWVFVIGLFLGTVRVKTGSSSLTILLHAASNLVAMIETFIAIEYFGR
ncbi:MAG: CPBP family intramembrane metalloprotease, partial [Planctomycetales bacterium]